MIKAIPTRYRGIQFRSKLEAAWAKFFDAHDVIWSYEVQGYDLDGVWYLPDFWLPNVKTIVEVKGLLDPISHEKVLALAKYAAPQNVFVILAGTVVGKEWSFVYPIPSSGPMMKRTHDRIFRRRGDEFAPCVQCGLWLFLDGSSFCFTCRQAKKIKENQFRPKMEIEEMDLD